MRPIMMRLVGTVFIAVGIAVLLLSMPISHPTPAPASGNSVAPIAPLPAQPMPAQPLIVDPITPAIAEESDEQLVSSPSLDAESNERDELEQDFESELELDGPE